MGGTVDYRCCLLCLISSYPEIAIFSGDIFLFYFNFIFLNTRYILRTPTRKEEIYGLWKKVITSISLELIESGAVGNRVSADA